MSFRSKKSFFFALAMYFSNSSIFLHLIASRTSCEMLIASLVNEVRRRWKSYSSASIIEMFSSVIGFCR